MGSALASELALTLSPALGSRAGAALALVCCATFGRLLPPPLLPPPDPDPDPDPSLPEEVSSPAEYDADPSFPAAAAAALAAARVARLDGLGGQSRVPLLSQLPPPPGDDGAAEGGAPFAAAAAPPRHSISDRLAGSCETRSTMDGGREAETETAGSAPSAAAVPVGPVWELTVFASTRDEVDDDEQDRASEFWQLAARRVEMRRWVLTRDMVRLGSVGCGVRAVARNKNDIRANIHRRYVVEVGSPEFQNAKRPRTDGAERG